MSASLVGSEMCIRDRDCRHQQLGFACRQRANGRAHIDDQKADGLGNGNICLLYTSDAADDM
eukprot:11792216-Alexandrium_andersonii.AAC.1